MTSDVCYIPCFQADICYVRLFVAHLGCGKSCKAVLLYPCAGVGWDPSAVEESREAAAKEEAAVAEEAARKVPTPTEAAVQSPKGARTGKRVWNGPILARERCGRAMRLARCLAS